MVFGDYYQIECRCRLAPAEADIWDEVGEPLTDRDTAIQLALGWRAQGRVVRVKDASGGVVWSSV